MDLQDNLVKQAVLKSHYCLHYLEKIWHIDHLHPGA